MPRTYVVTGAAGFIGSHLSRALLARGDRVVGVDNFDPFYDRAAKENNVAGLPADAFELIEADILDARAMADAFAAARPAAVFHFAALAGVRPSIEAPARYAAVNVEGLVNVLEATRRAGCSRVIFASSSSVYGNAARVPFRETDAVDDPISPYAATKRAGELVCRTYAHLHGMAVPCLRLFTVFGPGQRPDLAIAKFMRLMAEDAEIPMFGDGSTSRDYTYVDDIVRGVIQADARAASQGAGFFRTYNLGGSRPVRLSDLIESIARVTGATPRIRRLPMQPGDVDRTCADTARSRDELAFEPRVELEAGLERQWASARRRR